MNKTIIAIVIVAVVLVGGYFIFKGSPQPTLSIPQTSNQQPISPPSASEPSAQPPSPQSSADQPPAAEGKAVTYTDSGYSLGTLTVKKGETVTFKNQSSNSMWTASAVHPTHRVYNSTSLSEHCGNGANDAFDTCKGILPGGLWSFTFDNAGTWKYHNHLNPNDTGTIVVE